MLKSFYATPPLEQLPAIRRWVVARPRGPYGPEMISAMRLFFAYALVLERVYGIKFHVDYPLILTRPSPRPGSSATSRSISTGASWTWSDRSRPR